MKRACLLLALLLCPAMLQARERLSGHCERGGLSAVTQGIASTTKVQVSYPSCTVTVYYAVSGLIVPTADIYSDNAGTNLGNPFTSASDGFWYFYADNGRYNVRFSGVGSGIATPFTRGDYLLNDYWLTVPCDASAQIGADAGAKIAACIALLPATGGTVDARGLIGAQSIPVPLVINKPVKLLLGNSTYTLPTGFIATAATGIDVESDNVQIIGNGSTILQATRDWANGTFYGIGVFGFTGFVAEGLDIRITTIGAMPGVVYAVSGICVRGARTTYDPPSTNFRITNNRIWVRGATTDTINAKEDSIWIFGGGTTLRAKGGLISGNVFDDSHGRGLYLYDVENVTISGNTVRNLGATIAAATSIAHAIRVLGSREVTIADNTIIGSATSPGQDVFGIVTNGDTQDEGITICGNTLEFQGPVSGTLQGLNLSNIKKTVVIGNVLRYTGVDAGTGYGIYLRSVTPAPNEVYDILIAGNFVEGFTTNQLKVYDSDVRDVLIASNRFGKSVGNVANYYSIDAAAARVNYTSNMEGDSAGVYSRQAAPSFTGGILVGTATPATNRTFRVMNSYTSPGTGPVLADAALYLNEVTAPIAIGAITNTKTLGISSTNTQNWTGALAVDQSSFVAVAGATGTFAGVTAYQSTPALDAATATNFYGFRARANVGAGTITNPWSFKGEAGAGIAEIADGIKTKRLSAGVGTALVAGDFAVHANWGDTPAAHINSVVGTDQAFTFEVHAGTANFGANPTIILTFKDGTWTNNPICVADRGDATAPATGFATTATAATTMTLTFQGTPATGTYLFNVICIGR